MSTAITTIKLDLTDLNKFFEKPCSELLPLQPRADVPLSAEGSRRQRYAQLQQLKAMTARLTAELELSPSSSHSTLVDEDIGLFDISKVAQIEALLASPDEIQGKLDMFRFGGDRSQSFVDEIQRRTEHRRTLSINSDVTSCSSSSSPSNSFNPYAAPFVPSSITPPSLSVTPEASWSDFAHTFIPFTHSPSPPPAVVNLSEPSWFPVFWEGVSTKDAELHRTHSRALVQSIDWTSESLAVLAQHFCWKGADAASNGTLGVVMFAQVLHEDLTSIYGDWHANCLTSHIRECVVGHFKGCWKSEQPEAITYSHIPTKEYFNSALSLTTFIGELYSHSILPRSTVHHCLSILVAELNSIEHMQAIHQLLLHANAKLWRGKDAIKAVRDFVASFTQRASCLPEDASIMGDKFQKSEIRAWSKEITDMVNKWHVPRRVTQANGGDASSIDLQAGGRVVCFGLQMDQRR